MESIETIVYTQIIKDTGYQSICPKCCVRWNEHESLVGAIRDIVMRMCSKCSLFEENKKLEKFLPPVVYENKMEDMRNNAKKKKRISREKENLGRSYRLLREYNQANKEIIGK